MTCQILGIEWGGEKFLKELEHSQLIASVYQVCLLFEDILFGGPNVFESAVCLVCSVQSEKGTSHLAIDQNGYL